MVNVAVFSSTRGSNLQSLIEANLRNVKLVCLVTNVADCGAVGKARAAGIPVHFVNPADKSREDFDREVMAILEPYAVDFIVLGGYMRIIGAAMIQRYKNRIINVHPSLLPKFAGSMASQVYQAVLQAGEKETGMTIHYVDEGLDSGPIILQKSIAITPTDTPETLRQKVQALENLWYPQVVQKLAEESVKN